MPPGSIKQNKYIVLSKFDEHENWLEVGIPFFVVSKARRPLFIAPFGRENLIKIWNIIYIISLKYDKNSFRKINKTLKIPAILSKKWNMNYITTQRNFSPAGLCSDLNRNNAKTRSKNPT